MTGYNPAWMGRGPQVRSLDELETQRLALVRYERAMTDPRNARLKEIFDKTEGYSLERATRERERIDMEILRCRVLLAEARQSAA